MIRVGIIGYGYWGPNVVRNFADAPRARVHSICDTGADRIERAAARYPGVKVTTRADEVANRGIRETFEHLYHESRTEFVFLNSTDGQWSTRGLFDLLPLAGEWDVIIASRRDKHYRFGRRFVSWGFNQIPRTMYGVTTTDAGAVKLVRREIIERFELVSRSPFSEAKRLGALRDVVRLRRTLGARSAGALSMAESLDERTAESSNADQS